MSKPGKPYSQQKKPEYFIGSHTIKKIILLVTVILGIALQFANGASLEDHPYLRPVMTPYFQPNTHVSNGLEPYDYHGSGSLDGLTISQYDVDMAKDFVYRYQLDVNGNMQADQEDIDLLQAYVDLEIDHLPGHWNLLNGIEKRFWILKFIQQSKVYERGLANNWSCGGFAMQTSINTFGIENSESKEWGRNYDWTKNGRWNIPIYRVFTEVTLGIISDITTDNNGHFINGILVGPNTDEKYVEDPLKFSDWLFFEPQNNTIVKPGDFSMNTEAIVAIQ